VQEGTLIDWWIVSRETVFFLIYLAIISLLLVGNEVQLYGAIILVVLYVLHIFLMKFSSKYEIVIKKLLAQQIEIRELNKMAGTLMTLPVHIESENQPQIFRFHQNIKTEAICIEQLNRMEFSIVNGFIVFTNTLIQYKLRPIHCVKLGEE
jgi:Ca2+/Na+ antiporter